MSKANERERISRLLVVEDDDSQRQTLTDILGDEGFEVIDCATAGEAVKHVQDDDFGVAVVDLRLPDLSGTQLLERIREMNGQVRVIIHTGYGSFESAKEAVNLGAFAYVEKLQDPAILVGHVHRAFREHLTRYADSLEEEVARRRQAEKELQEAERRYRTLFEQLPDAVVMIDPQTTLPVEFNELAPGLLGYSREEFARLRIADYEASQTPEETQARLGRVLRQGEDQFETRMRTKQGEIRDVRVSIRLVEIGGRSFFHNIFRDITERKHSEAERARLAAALEAAGEAIFITDAAGTIEYVNPAFERIHGYSREEAVGQTPRILKGGRGDDAVYAQMWQTLRSGRTWQGSFLNRRKDGSVFDAEATIAPLSDPSGRDTCYVAVVRDVTARLEAEQRIRQREAELAHVGRLHTLGELAGGLAHEINQPLAAIANYARGSARRLRSGAYQPAELLGTMKEIAAQAERAGRIVQRIRDLVRKREPRRSTIAVNDIVRDALELVGPAARRRDTTIGVELAEGLPSVRADGIQIQQVVLNLIQNGMDAMEDVAPGRRRLAVSTAPAGSNTVQVSVRDEGTGLSSEMAKQVFDPFFTTKPEGMGMGLSISWSIIEGHGGRVWCEPNDDRGTTFLFTLPACPPGTEDAT